MTTPLKSLKLDLGDFYAQSLTLAQVDRLFTGLLAHAQGLAQLVRETTDHCRGDKASLHVALFTCFGWLFEAVTKQDTQLLVKKLHEENLEKWRAAESAHEQALKEQAVEIVGLQKQISLNRATIAELGHKYARLCEESGV